jgi:hypothetical protein
MAEFVAGRVLAAALHAEVVGPLLHNVPHAAALWGTGSDVLGYDTPQSTDHGWGPRMQVFVEDVARAEAALADLPETFRGWPLRYGWDAVPVQGHVRVTTLSGWLRGHLDLDPRAGMTALDWLTIPQQILLEVSGPVLADPDGELRRVQGLLAAFPLDVRRWVLGCQWHRIGEEEAFVGRAAQVGDELGARVVATRLVRELMRVGFLLAGAYWPYTKWFGTAFARLPVAVEWGPSLKRVLAASSAQAREAALVEAYEAAARAHNATGLTAAVEPTARPYYGRPFRVLGAGRFAAACHAAVTDPWLAGLPPVGSVDQVADSTPVLSSIAAARTFRAIYGGPGEHSDRAAQ